MTKEITIKENKLEQFEVFFPENPESSRLLVACAPHHYSASEVARAVEDCDARLLNLNVTSLALEGGRLGVALRVSHRDPERVARSLERYGYEVVGLESDPDDDARLRDNLDQLLHLLEI